MKTYRTKSGDMWDMIARDKLGGERYTTLLIEANPQYIGVAIFPAGVILKLPEIKTPIPAQLPPWKR